MNPGQHIAHLWFTAISVIIVSAIGYALTACQRSLSYDPVPRPAAYYRIEQYPSSYHPVRCGSIMMQVNDSAAISHPAPTQLDIRYPRYKAVIYCTVTPVTAATLPSVMHNRTERMALNAGSNPSTVYEMQDSAFTSRILVTPSGSIIPLQFLATDSSSVVISGAAMLQGRAPVRPDSIAPVVETLSRDISHMLGTLQQAAQ